MTASTTHESLIRLRDVILEERECTKMLDMETLATIMEEKEELIKVLAHSNNQLDDADKEIAADIKYQNRRNAYLFKATLGWIRETMEFFGKRNVASGYSANGGTTSAAVNGRLLSGQV